MLSSSRDNWERLVAAVLKKELYLKLAHQQSRSPSICSTISSDDLSQQTLSFSGSSFELFSIPPSPLLPSKNSQVNTSASISNNASSRSISRMLFSAWYGRKKSHDPDLVDIPGKSHDPDLVDIPEDFVLCYLRKKSHAAKDPVLKRFSLQELQNATDKFSIKNIMGSGTFGNVYKGRLADGSLVSIKRLGQNWTPDGELQFQTEIEISSMAVHRNLRRLRGFCITPTERLLVYPYMANGSVASCLRARPENILPPLGWKTRKHIALGSAKGLSYLHDKCGQRIIHRDVKAGHIFLDQEYEAVVGDFSLAILMDFEEANLTTSVRGTTGPVAPEYASTGNVSEKTDVFGYGIVLFELITGQRPFDLSSLANHDHDVTHLDWAKELFEEKKLGKIVDPDLQSNYVEEEVEQLIQVAFLCTQSSAMGRPKMSEVVKLLEGNGLAEKWDEWKKVELRFLP